MSSNRKYQEFVAEAEDIIQSLNTGLSHLQVLSSSSQEVHPDILSELFGSIHTLKGISSTLGFTNIATLSHKMEDMLDNLRFGQIRITDNMFDIFSEGTDSLTRLLRNINDTGEEYFKIDPLLDKIAQTLHEQEKCEEIPIEGSISVGPDLLSRLSDIEAHRLTENLKYGAFLYRIKASFSVDTLDEDLTRLQDRLKGFGEIITFIPASGFSAEKRISFEIIFTSKNGEIDSYLDDIRKINTINIEDIESLHVSKQRAALTLDMPAEASLKSIARTVRVDIDGLDTILNSVGEILLMNDSILQAMKDLKTRYRNDKPIHGVFKISKELSGKLAMLRNNIIEIRMIPVNHMFNRLTKLATKLSKDLAKEIRIEVYGGDNKLDKSIIERLVDPIMHIIRNAVDHGIEDKEIRLSAGKSSGGTISLRAFHKNNRILIEVEDDGAGIDFQGIYRVALDRGLLNKKDKTDEKGLIKFLFQPGFSTSDSVNEVSGRGVGLDVVARSIASLGGMIDVETKDGKGTKFSITVPLTFLIAKALIVAESNRYFAIPFNAIYENFILNNKEIKKIGGKETFNIRGCYIPLIRLKDILEKRDKQGAICKADKQYVIVVGLGGKKAGIIVDAIEGQREILLKPLSELLGVVPYIAGFTEIGAKRILPVIDVSSIIDRCVK